MAGGASARPAWAPGPRLTAGSRWRVAALDGDGNAIAISAVRPVSP
jgi:hypothetical protein